ncbi:MAG: hypothetical protein WCT46_04200, partial [Candidatus Gracilibacteria bacterium]
DVGIISFAEGEESTSTATQTTISDCPEQISGALAEKSAELLENAQTALSSTGTTTEVVDETLIPLDVQFREAADEIFEDATATYDLESGIPETSNYLATCQALVEKEVENNEVVLKTMVASSASAKETTALLDEYKWINEKLREMLETTGYVNAYLSKISSSSFEFTKTCVSRGK